MLHSVDKSPADWNHQAVHSVHLVEVQVLLIPVSDMAYTALDSVMFVSHQELGSQQVPQVACVTVAEVLRILAVEIVEGDGRHRISAEMVEAGRQTS